MISERVASQVASDARGLHANSGLPCTQPATICRFVTLIAGCPRAQSPRVHIELGKGLPCVNQRTVPFAVRVAPIRSGGALGIKTGGCRQKAHRL